ncbi:MAG: carboxypeptidase regulatory-like domain-containing protein, partial [Acidobacteria bacterium]|nr:carboxypeptidase regulatory-like domain-containing protein [Acidobacteriota bacterium]
MNKFGRSAMVLMIPILSLALCTAPMFAQTTTGTILGTVKDQSGGLLPGASVIIKNTDTGASREVITDDAGRYRAVQLALGNYEVEASLSGFQTEVRSGIKLTVGREAVVDFSLSIGEISERVQVTGDAPIVETASSTIAGLVDDKKIRDLPLNGRSFSDLVTLQMGAVPQTLGVKNAASGFGLKIAVSGARPSENSFLLDGNFVNDALNNTPAGATGLFLGVETLREFTVMTNTFSAEYGQSAGAIVSAVTKSGTNELHGSLFYFHRNSALDARNFFDRPDRVPTFRRHQFGGVAGGPIVENKTFFFGGYEGLREGLGTTSIVNTLTAEARQG